MADFKFFGARSDRRQILELLLGVGGFTWFREGNYDSPLPEPITREEIDEMVNRGAMHYYIAPGVITALPSMPIRASEGAIVGWFIDAAESPAMLELMLPRDFEKKGRRLNGGMLAYPATPHVPGDPGILKGAFSELLNPLKRTLLKSKTIHGKRAWLTASALEAYENGAALMQNGVWVKANGDTEPWTATRE